MTYIDSIVLKEQDKSLYNRKRSLWNVLIKYKELYLLFIPVALWYIIFCYIPMSGIIIAFKDYKFLQGIFGSQWVGFKHFERFLTSRDFLNTLRNTLLISSYNLLFVFPAPIIFALMLNELKYEKFKKVIQTVSYLPHFISWAVAGGLFYLILSPSNGFVNTIIQSLGFKPMNFMGDVRYFRSVIVVSGMWKSTGWTAIIYLASLAGVDPQLYEAATIDGAKRLQRIWHVTLPSIKSVIVIMLILAVGNILYIGFEQIYIMINVTVLDVGETIDYYIYRVGLYDFTNFSYVTAIGLFKSVIGFFLILMTNVTVKKIDEDTGGIW